MYRCIDYLLLLCEREERERERREDEKIEPPQKM
jgi:hypothetical protein